MKRFIKEYRQLIVQAKDMNSRCNSQKPPPQLFTGTTLPRPGFCPWNQSESKSPWDVCLTDRRGTGDPGRWSSVALTSGRRWRGYSKDLGQL